MRRLIKDGEIFDKYASFEKKKFREDTIEQFNWNGHINITGTYKGAAYSTSLADNFMANNLRKDSNPKGSILVEAKNYTDAQIANINSGESKHTHYIGLRGSDAQVFFTYISDKADKYTIETLKSTLNTTDKKIPCSGYWSVNPALYIYGNGSTFKISVFQNNTTKIISVDFTSIDDYVE